MHEYLIILEIPAENSLKLNFYEDCIDKHLGVCTPKTNGNEHYLRYFSRQEKRECQSYEQVAQSMDDVLQFCVDMGNSSWYGGAEVAVQYWPLNNLNWTNNPYVTKSSNGQPVSINLEYILSVGVLLQNLLRLYFYLNSKPDIEDLIFPNQKCYR